MNTMFFNAVSCFFVCAGLIIALILAINVIFHRQSMKIMNIVWVLTGLWGHYFALFAYYTFGVRKDNMVATVPMENMKMDMKISMEMDMSEVRPQWQSITLSALHCGARLHFGGYYRRMVYILGTFADRRKFNSR